MKITRLTLILSVLALSLSIINGELDDFCTISGNVKGLSHETDFSSIFVKLFNKQGNLKEKTEISDTGFFILPIYDKGEYIIRVSAPAGLSFEPEEIPFNFDGECTQKTDVNFMFKGFGITGKVNIFNNPSNVGAKGITIKLFNDKRISIATTQTDDQGIFTFSPIVPGSYRVQASHASWHFTKSEHDVTVTTGNTNLPENSLLVSGFNLHGSIAQPSINIGLLIYNRKGQQTFHKCNEKMPKGEISQKISNEFDAQPLCFVNVDNNGDYSFQNLATGKYLIVPYVDKSSIEFNISPSYIEAQIKIDNEKLSEIFEINGFSATGRVALSAQNKKGVSGATIKVNGKVEATTDANGGFTLKNIKEGLYTIQVSVKDLQFNDENVKISMTNPKISEIYVSGFKVCGKVVSEKSFKVLIKSGGLIVAETVSDPESGSFCTFLGNGKYSLEVEIEESEKRSGLQFYPIQQHIEVNSAAVNDVIFSQLRAKITGEVQCLADDDDLCKNIEVTLSALDDGGYQTSTLKARTKNGIYSFEEILPGRYQLSVPNDQLCWEKNQQKIVVQSTVEKVPKFIQNGYKIGPLISTHDSQATYKFRTSDNSAKSESINFSSGANEICVSKAGIYDMKVSGCHIFEEDTKVLSTKSTSPIHVTAIKHKNGIRILSEISQQFNIEVQYEDDSKDILKPVEQKERVDGYVAYNLNLNIKNGEVVKLTPKSEQMLFKPSSTELKGASDCVDVAVNFIATKGLVITGRTEPKISDVKVTLSFPKNNELSHVQTTTNVGGEFKFPTIDPTLDFELKAEKESYVFQDYDATRNIFEGHKLCEIIVLVKDEESKELANAVISLASENYRKNLPTSTNGEIKFHSLKPGKYFLRAMMKEYDFKPNSQTIEIRDGETLNIELSAKRVAYSVFGKITTLSGDPFANVMVEAISTSDACSNHQEEAVTEFNGQYRIRGLQTGCDYKIRLQKNVNVDRSLPSERQIHVETVDTQNVNFIAINPINICDVIVKIKSKVNDHYKTLKIQMFKRESPDNPVYSQRIENLMLPKSKHNDDILVFLPRINANDYQKAFFIELTTTLSDKSYNYKLPQLQFTANTTNIYFEVDFNPVVLRTETELNKNSLVALVLIFLVAFVFLKQELVFEIVRNLVAKFSNDVSKQPTKKTEGRGEKFIDENEINELAQFIEERKKKKSRKNN